MSVHSAPGIKQLEAQAEIPVSRPPKWRAMLCKAWNWITTPKGFFITLYGLNIVAWGGMLFLLMCNAAPAMCHPTCDDLYSARRKWIEIDSQILNALFCVTGFGLAPWRFRDLYWWFCWRLGGGPKRLCGIARLACIHRSWCRFPGPGTGGMTMTPPTAPWKIDLFVWCNIWNTIFQVCLASCMWGMDRFNRPSWTTGLFVALACGVAGVAGWVSFSEGRRVARYEGADICDNLGATSTPCEPACTQ
ncbi:hypothetical protein BJX68DRAFT_257741 [Aspergillus pseudodeflectus]|uniref:Uncharacterized protein n=1 Tax=Aspergillus pseudodeflectus TaxID=176178 RepID=A0ABR4JRL7_9EURO